MAREDLGDLGRIIERLEERGRLVRVRSEVDPVHDLAGVAAQAGGAGGGGAVRARQGPRGAGVHRPLLVAGAARGSAGAAGEGAAGLRLRLHQGVAAEARCRRSWSTTGRWSRSRRTRSILRKLPIPTHALKDGGPYFDAAVVIAKDPETGVRNASIQRFMVVGQGPR